MNKRMVYVVMFPLKFPLCVLKVVTSLPDGKISAFSKLKAFADEKLNLTQTAIFSIGQKNIVGNTENAVYQHFLLFTHCFQRVLT